MALKVVGNSITLNDGNKMPLLGLGSGVLNQLEPGLVSRAVETALDCGYRHIDTAYMYKSEEEVGTGIQNWLKKTGRKREEIFCSYKGMERMVGLGLTKSIGISNFSIKQTRRLIAISKIPPAVNQVFNFALDETDKRALLLLDKGEKGRFFLFTDIFKNDEHPEI
ncbi:Aldose reductase [Armadillidium nasatum]|uniref:Aldose reductase n=1 Tax=Armadillidium nasatum TaxID=96803 RepID=A0A5N5SKZ5_9CRUS|nr:Aldose reductase [Armadillidium nasatum]